MSKFENLFNILPNGGLTINKQELRGHVVLKTLITNTDKAAQVRTLLYVYLMADVRSMYEHLGREDRDHASRKHVGFDTFWNPNASVLSSIEYYQQLLELSPTGKAFTSASKALYETGTDIKDLLDNSVFFKNLLKKKMDFLKETELLGDKEQDMAITECTALMKGILENQKEITKQIKELPSLINIVEELGLKWASEGNGREEIYGGGELGNRE